MSPAPRPAATSGRRGVTVAAVLIVKDEEAVLERCLQSVAWADEIVVYDTGSTDATREIAGRFTDTVVEGYWDDDFAAARNRALAHATADWVLSIDADEELVSSPGALRKRLARLEPGIYAVAILNETTPLAPLAQTTGPRVFSRAGHCWEGRLHEQVRRVGERATPISGMLTGITLQHSGYTVEAVVSHDKRARNLQVVRAQLDDAVAAGDIEAIGVARVHLLRSLVFASQYDEAREVAEDAWRSPATPRLQGQLAESLVDMELGAKRHEQAEVWANRWLEIEPTLPAATLALARVQGARGQAEQALATFRSLPVSRIGADGAQFDRWSHAALEVALLLTLGRADEAFATVREALRRGQRIFRSVEVLGSFGEERFVALLDELGERQWRDWCQQCVERPSPAGLHVLDVMDRHRPRDLAVVLSACRLGPFLSLEQAGEWSARLRSLGLSDGCPLLALADDERRAPRERAIAAALLVSAYQDTRAIDPLQRALAAVPAAEQDALAAELEVVAPGLVSHS